jgi:hypothetical protein
MGIKSAYGIAELAKAGPLGRSSLYKAIKEQRLIAQKAGRRTIITCENYQAFLKSLPVFGHDKGAALVTGANRSEAAKRFPHETVDAGVISGDKQDADLFLGKEERW